MIAGQARNDEIGYFTQSAVPFCLLVVSHINSYTRKNLAGATPFEAAPAGFCGDGIYNALGLSAIDPEAINLTPGLLAR